MKSGLFIEGITKEEFLNHLSSLAPENKPPEIKEVVETPQPKTQEVFTKKEAAEYLRLSIRSLQYKMEQKKITYSKEDGEGKTIRFTKENLDKYLKRYEHSSK